MRKVNSIVGPVIIILFLIHAISGAFQLFGIIPGGETVREVLSYIMVAAVALHMFIGIKLTFDTMLSCKKSGRSYFKGNELFWIRRISGFALILFIIYHMCVFMSTDGEVFRLNNFGALQLTAHILLTLVMVLHLLMNIKPLFMALGIANRKYLIDVIIILAAVLLLCAAGFIVYYCRWNISWRYGG